MIVLSINSFNNFNDFKELNNLSDTEYKKLETKAKTLYKNYTGLNNFNSESCFISSSSLNGFYFPNSRVVRCIAFLKSNNKPCILIY